MMVRKKRQRKIPLLLEGVVIKKPTQIQTERMYWAVDWAVSQSHDYQKLFTAPLEELRTLLGLTMREME